MESIATARTRKIKGVEMRKERGWPRSHPKNMSELMPAVESFSWRQNLKVVAQRTQTPLQDEEQWRCTCTRPVRGEAEDRES
jgi:hypothetical protein